jgi:hypothetical protein
VTGVIDRPETSFDAIEHAYYSETGERLLGVSTVAKVGGVDDTWGIASAWGFRIGYEGAHELLSPIGGGADGKAWPATKDDLRQMLKDAGLTPWATRDRAADRGSWVHDVLEELGQEGQVPDMRAFEAKHGAEAAGHARSVMAWFLAMRPQFVAMEVQVASRTHGFAGRYDVRAKVEARRVLQCIDPLRDDEPARRVRELAERGEWALGLIDLKTSKGIYPTTHFPQLEGYEGAGVEMGYPATDFRAVLNTWPTGEHESARDFAVSWSTYEDFLGYLGAMRSIRRLKAADPEVKREKLRDGAILANLPARSRDLAQLGLPELHGMDSRAIGMRLGTLRKRGLVEQPVKGGEWQAVGQ